MTTWNRKDLPNGATVYYTDRPNGDELTVTANLDGTHNIIVYSPSTNTEFYLGELEDTTVTACIERAESVRLPEEDTGI